MYAVKFPSAMSGSVCVKIPYKGYEISLAFDDSCGRANNYIRSYIAIYDSNDSDVTKKFIAQDYAINGEDLKSVFDAIDNHA